MHYYKVYFFCGLFFLYRVAALTIGPTNVTIPPTLISENERKELIITAFVSIGSCVLLKDDLESAIMVLIAK